MITKCSLALVGLVAALAMPTGKAAEEDAEWFLKRDATLSTNFNTITPFVPTDIGQESLQHTGMQITCTITNAHLLGHVLCDESKLQLVLFPENSKVTYAMDKKGRSYILSDLPSTSVPSNGQISATMHPVPPGKYLLAAQPLCIAFTLPLVVGLNGDPVVIKVPDSTRPPFSIKLGQVYIPIPK